MKGRMKLRQGAQQLSGGRTIEQSTVETNTGGDNVQLQIASSLHPVDPEFDKMRKMMVHRISELLSRDREERSNQVSGLAKRLETLIYRENRTKAAYSIILNGEIHSYLQHIIVTNIPQVQQYQQMKKQLTSSSSYGTAIPRPDVVQSTSGNARASYEMDKASGNLMAGSMSNKYHDSSTNFPLHSTANGASLVMSAVNMQERHATHMIRTSGSSNQQSLAANCQYSSGAGYLNGELNVMVQMQQQQGPFASKNNCCLVQRDLEGYADSGVHSDILDISSSCGLSEAYMIGGMGLNRPNVQLINRTVVPEALINSSPYGSSPSKPFQWQVNRPTQSTSTPADLAVSTSFVGTGSSVLSTTGNRDMTDVNLLPESRMDCGLIASQTTVQPLQRHPYIKVEGLDLQEMLSLEQLQQQANQSRLSQPHSLIQQQNSQIHHVMSRGNFLMQRQLGSDHAEKQLDQRNQLHSELMSSQINEHVDLPNLQRHCTQTQYHDNYKKGQMSASSQNLGTPHDLLPPQQQCKDGSNRPSCFLTETYTKPLESHCRLKPTKEVHETSVLNGEIQDGFCQRKTVQDKGHHPVLSDWHNDGCDVTSVDPRLSKLRTRRSDQVKENEKYYQNQARLILFLVHAKSCPAPRGSCKSLYCDRGRKLVNHLMGCQTKECIFQHCRDSKKVSDHYKTCVNAHCPVCSKVKEMLRRSSEQAHKQSPAKPVLVTPHNMNQRITNRVHVDGINIDLVAVETFDDQPPAAKRSKLQTVSTNATENVPVRQENPGFMLQEVHPRQLYESKRMVPNQELDVGIDTRPPQVNLVSCYGSDEKIGGAQTMSSGVLNEICCHVQQETSVADKEKSVAVVDVERKTGSMDVMISKTGKPKVKGVSLMELFTPEQIHEHIKSLRQWVGQSKSKAEKNQVIGYSESANLCQLCKVEKLNFEPPPMYCSPCCARIKRNASYYTGSTAMGRLYFCISCYNASLGKTIEVELIKLSKADLEKRRNNVETEEGWVQCDKCECWQHQICALFNARRNDVGQAEYTCSKCYIEELKRGLRMPLPENAVCGAKDLPRTLLSDHIEERLLKRLREERQKRADKLKTSLGEIPGADGLVVRVVSSVDKKLEVKPRFFKLLQEDNYPAEFPYKSKAILLFQKIEGVEVCLFGMYVQEYGAECKFPNQRRVYISYLDSVKYLRPDIETVSGEALRTYVYHEILIGYLEFCKQRGFTSCYIWACPPTKGEDYIFYCHPEIQKTPKSDKLREWYLCMLQKAIKENIVVELTNLYDHFFVTTKECKTKVAAARLPYFDGDYWPGAAEEIINQLLLEDNGMLQKKGNARKIITKRALKAVGHTDLSGNASKEAILMQKLGETIYRIKDDLIMVHLQYPCSHCSILMVSGKRWVCNECKSFYICDRCYDAEQRLEEEKRHPINRRYSHTLHPVEIVGVPEDTKDRDAILENVFFDTRQAFLSFCQGKNYQYDTLRRAKHSTMMILYHLHDPSGPAFVATCNVCNHDIETGQGWHCEDCPDFDMCASCYQKHGGAKHHHKLTNNPSSSGSGVQNKGALKKRLQQTRAILELATHASSCHHPSCQYPNCRKFKELFYHGAQCKVRLSGGCKRCTKMWSIIRFHTQYCRQSDCPVPRCRDLKSHKRKMDQLSESRRRASVNEMVRQRAAEVAHHE
ncbi:probable histone acetyltransferase HAC-like 2 [Oryza brachyantha]|uniref:probable histone acetyltransferase HAC-like 2 n=1 Tax=Oryza brachyantha TaxID=4533 RepID=UPI001ADC282E|nr:probable histone acetyltransferase HAC-like 2 [Oryza brachyantha]